MIGFFQEFAVI